MFAVRPRSALRAALAVAFLLGPTLTASAMLWCRLGATLADCGLSGGPGPGAADESHYRREMEGFARAGLGTGYYCPDEKPAPAGWSRWGAHGAAYPGLYGTLGKAIGMPRAAGPVLHAGFLAAAAAVWLWRVRPTTGRLAVVTALWLTWWPVVLFAPSHLQEPFHGAAAVALAAVVGPGLNAGTARPRALAAALAAISLAAPVRVSWGLAALAWAVAALPGASRRFRWLAGPAVLAAVAGLAAYWRWSTAPYPWSFNAFVAEMRVSPLTGLGHWLRYAGWQTRYFLSPAEALPVLALRYQTLALLLGLTAYLGRGSLRRLPDNARREPAVVFALVNLALTLAFVLFFHEVDGWKDYRVLAPHLLLSLLVLATSSRWRACLAVAVVNLAILPAAVSRFEGSHRARVGPHAEAADLSPWVRFEPGAPPWSNTLVAPDPSVGPVRVPAGVGVIPRTLGIVPPLKSRWVLLRSAPPAWLGVRLEKVADTPAGTLYRNLATPAGPAVSPAPWPRSAGG